MEAYGHCKREAQHLQPDYQPETVNTDGWSPTQNAWRALFPQVTIIECFLHAFLKIRSYCMKRFQSVFHQIKQQVWDIYHAPDPDTFKERIQTLHKWAQHALAGTAQVRAWALVHNFSPYCPRAKVSKDYQSPANKLNGSVYHDN